MLHYNTQLACCVFYMVAIDFLKLVSSTVLTSVRVQCEKLVKQMVLYWLLLGSAVRQDILVANVIQT